MQNFKSFRSQGKHTLPLLLAFLLLLTACGSGNNVPEDGIIRLTYAVLNEKAANEARMEAKRFNTAHQDIKVEVKEYFNENGRQGRDRLLTEIMAGQMPDIIHLGDDLSYNNSEDTASKLPYQSLARKGYLEDLWPYIENDPDLGREGILEAPLRAAEVDGGLYTVFNKVTIRTTSIAERLAGSRESWTLAEMLEIFHAMPEEAIMFPGGIGRDFIFYTTFSGSIESYVDWNTGACSFTSDKFKSALEFVRSFPAKSIEASDTAALDAEREETADKIRGGLLMQYPSSISNPSHVQWMDAYLGYGGKVVFLGVPTEDGSSGSYYQLAGKPLAMSSACQYKEAAWEFLRSTLLPRYTDFSSLERYADSFACIPINRSDYDLVVQASLRGKHSADFMQLYGLPAVRLRNATREEVDRFEALLNRTERINLYDENIYNIAYEVAEVYFAGDKTLDEAAQLIQDRVTLYLDEGR